MNGCEWKWREKKESQVDTRCSGWPHGFPTVLTWQLAFYWLMGTLRTFEADFLTIQSLHCFFKKERSFLESKRKAPYHLKKNSLYRQITTNGCCWKDDFTLLCQWQKSLGRSFRTWWKRSMEISFEHGLQKQKKFRQYDAHLQKV